MQVFKFGGASVRDAAAVKNVANILRRYPDQQLVVVISAMGKSTNALEAITAAYLRQEPNLPHLLEAFLDYHAQIASGLQLTEDLLQAYHLHCQSLRNILAQAPSDNPDFDYDQVVSYGELLSTLLVSAYLQQQELPHVWSDARRTVRTDHTYREAKVDWPKTTELIQAAWQQVLQQSAAQRPLLLTQGFIGHTAERSTTTLGREGSDFSAAIFAYALQANSVTIWKDVPGMLNADPKYFSDVVKLKRISYKEAIELSYYGASVIHPKTIKPLQNKQIALYVKSFLSPDAEGTVIERSTFSDSLVPSYIFKVQQVLISFTPRDFSFVSEDHLSELFALFSRLRVHIHLMQNSAINFSICTDHREEQLRAITQTLTERYEVLYNYPCELVTIRHYDQETISRLLIGKKVLVEQRSRNTARMVLQEA